MSNFTQGKWYVEEYVPEGVTLNGSEYFVRNEKGKVIAIVNREADARAISLIPEMYRALEELIPILESDNRLAIAYSIKRLLERIDGPDGDTEVKS